jgi:hypothetical protein
MTLPVLPTTSRACNVFDPGLAHKSNTFDPTSNAPTPRNPMTGNMEPSS